jgi:hypothetical protein
MAACAAFREESRIRFVNAANLDRKSGFQRLASMKQEWSTWPSAHEAAAARSHEEHSEHLEAAKRGKHSCKVYFHSASPIALRRSEPVQSDADIMQNQGCTTSTEWLPWVMAALQVGCPVALKGVFCTGASAPVAGFRLKPDTVSPRKFDV